MAVNLMECSRCKTEVPVPDDAKTVICGGCKTEYDLAVDVDTVVEGMPVQIQTSLESVPEPMKIVKCPKCEHEFMPGKSIVTQVTSETMPDYVLNSTEYKYAKSGRRGNPYRAGSTAYKIFDLFITPQTKEEAEPKVAFAPPTRLANIVSICIKVGLMVKDENQKISIAQ